MQIRLRFTAPIRACSELEAQPDHRTECTAKLDVANRKSKPRLRSFKENGRGSSVTPDTGKVQLILVPQEAAARSRKEF